MSDHPNGQACKSCKFYLSDNGTTGVCRVNPPTVVVSNYIVKATPDGGQEWIAAAIQGHFAQMSGEDGWCGHWKTKLVGLQ